MVGGHKKKIKSIWETQHLFGKFPPCIVPILFLASCDENPEESWYFFGCPDGQPTQELGSRDPFGQYMEVGPRGCEDCSLGSRLNTPPAGGVEKGAAAGQIQAGGQATSTKSVGPPKLAMRMSHNFGVEPIRTIPGGGSAWV
jgi:hypothetical protein